MLSIYRRVLARRELGHQPSQGAVTANANSDGTIAGPRRY
jgi:hypothetical protein